MTSRRRLLGGKLDFYLFWLIFISLTNPDNGLWTGRWRDFSCPGGTSWSFEFDDANTYERVAPTFTAPTAPYNYQMATVVGTETSIVSFTTTVTGTLTCNLQSVNPASTGFECRVDNAKCACYVKAGQTWTDGTQYQLIVEAFDSADPGNPTTFNGVMVDVKNAAPTFDNLDRTETKNALTGVTGSNVLQVSATDLDGDTLTYSLTSGTDFFTINPATGQITVKQDLIRSTNQVIDVGVQVTDGQNNAVTGVYRVNLQNANTVPYVTNWPRNETVIESIAGGSTICPVNVVDPDNPPLTYSIQVTPTPQTTLFEYDAFTKSVILAAGQTLNYEEQRYHEIKLTVNDKYSTSSEYICKVYVTDDNDVPVFTKAVYSVSMTEETFTELDTRLTVTDDDQDGITYRLMDVNESNWFSIDRTNGKISPVIDIDREAITNDQLWLTVLAIDDRGATGTSQILVNVDDVNDNCPDFGQNGQQGYSFTSNQFTAAAGTIGTLAATDPDLGKNADFTIATQTTADGYYTLLSTGAVVMNTAGSNVAYGTTEKMTVVAIDQGTPQQTCSTIINIIHQEAATTTTTTTTTTQSYNFFDKPENIAIIALIALALAALVGLGIYFCLRYCCPRGGVCAGDCRNQCRCNCEDDCCGERRRPYSPSPPPSPPPQKRIVARPITVMKVEPQPQMQPYIVRAPPPMMAPRMMPAFMPPPMRPMGPVMSSMPPAPYGYGPMPIGYGPPGTPSDLVDSDDDNDDADNHSLPRSPANRALPMPRPNRD